MKIKFFLLFLISVFAYSCATNPKDTATKTPAKKTENVKTPAVSNETVNAANTEANVSETPLTNKTDGDNSQCYNLKRNDLMLDKKQTFAIDFKPFEKSCFVTFHDPEFENPALGSQFFIYKNGKEVFNFPDQFGAGNITCWADAVSFEDVNNDQLKDIIIVGKCGEKSGSYNENMVYINTGKDFMTNSESNAETMDFSKVSQIREFIKKNPKMFIP